MNGRGGAVIGVALGACALLGVGGSGAGAIDPTQPAYVFTNGTAVGIPDEDVGTAADSGMVLWFPDNGSYGLSPSGVVELTEASVGGTVVAGNRFGAATAFGDVNLDGYRDLAIGAPGANNGAGRVYIVLMKSDGSGFDLGHHYILRQGSGGIPGTAEAGDHFGASVTVNRTANGAPWLAIGAPDEDVGSTADAGDVTVVPRGTDTAHAVEYYQGNHAPGTTGTSEHFATALAPWGPGLAIGVPGQKIGSAAGAGEVDFLSPGSVDGLPGDGTAGSSHQGADSVPGSPEAGDHFGATVVETFLVSGVGQEAIGAPDEDIGSAVDAGALTIWSGPGSFHGSAELWYQGLSGLAGTPETGDHFAASLSTNGESIAIGVPGEGLGNHSRAGIVQVLHQCCGFAQYNAMNDQVFSQDAAGVPDVVESGDQFGAVVSGLSGNTRRFVIASPGEDTDGVSNTGSLTVVSKYDTSTQEWLSTGIQRIDQNSSGVPGANETNDQLGRGTATVY